MQIETRGLGIVDVKEEQIITLKDGFFGFEDYHKFAMLDSTTPPFIWIESIIKGGPAFIVMDPFIFRPDYEIDLNDSVTEALELTSPSDALIFCLITISEGGEKMTANLQGPLVINKKNRRAMQVVAGGEWKTKHDIFAELEEKGSK